MFKSSTGIPSPPLAFLVKVKSLSCVWLFATPWTVAYQAPPSMGFSRQEYWSGLSIFRSSSPPRDWTQFSCIVDRRFTIWVTREAFLVAMLSKAHLTSHSRMSGSPWSSFFSESCIIIPSCIKFHLLGVWEGWGEMERQLSHSSVRICCHY